SKILTILFEIKLNVIHIDIEEIIISINNNIIILLDLLRFKILLINELIINEKYCLVLLFYILSKILFLDLA
mgnify:CR=1